MATTSIIALEYLHRAEELAAGMQTPELCYAHFERMLTISVTSEAATYWKGLTEDYHRETAREYAEEAAKEAEKEAGK